MIGMLRRAVAPPIIAFAALVLSAAAQAMDVRAPGAAPTLRVEVPDGSHTDDSAVAFLLVSPPGTPRAFLELGTDTAPTPDKGSRADALDGLAAKLVATARESGGMKATSGFVTEIEVAGRPARLYRGVLSANKRDVDYELIVVDLGQDRVGVMMILGDLKGAVGRGLIASALAARIVG